MEHYKTTSLWKNAFAEQGDGFDEQRDKIVFAYSDFRERVSKLLGLIHSDLPSLTVHDITHVDKLWDVGSEIAGPDYPLNPAEAFVLGGAFLLHDAAHCRAAFPGGLEELKTKIEWKDAAAQRGLDAETLVPGSEYFQIVLFDTLRVLHPTQARKLPFVHWSAPGETTPHFLLPSEELRLAYGEAIGEIAESHWWHPHQLETLAHRTINSPICLQPTKWTVDLLKIAALLRTADAAHLDANRAPRFLYALKQPKGISRQHWQFQSKLHQATADPERQELRITGQAFAAHEQEAWWLAYDSCRMVDGELRAVDRILREHRRERFVARSLADAHCPEDFARHVQTAGWQPVDAVIKITDVKNLVDRFGGEKLYGDKPWLALRELLQNARDAVVACRALGGLGQEEGEIEVALESTTEGDWLHVTDTGIGMSRYVLTSVLLDFGRSLWRSSELRGEWAGLASSKFEAVGQFGIGFFSVFMLGSEVKVLTCRYEAKDDEDAHALLHFPNGTASRPVLLTPSRKQRLNRHGTSVSVRLLPEKRDKLIPEIKTTLGSESAGLEKNKRLSLAEVCAELAPALSINLYVKENSKDRQCVVQANDWLSLEPAKLLLRIAPRGIKLENNSFGPWSHLQPIYNLNGRCIGRCAIDGSEWVYKTRLFGIGVIGGINAGPIPRLVGVIEALNQEDLARQTAIPAISLKEFKAWAEEQKQILINASKLTLIHSQFLAALGCSSSGLIVAKHNGTEISFEDFQKIASEFTEFYLHDGNVSHEDNDDMSSDRFNNNFQPDEKLLVTKSNYGVDCLEKLPKVEADAKPYTLESAVIEALKIAWDCELNEEYETVVVGTVDSQEIKRICTIVSRSSQHDEHEA